MNVMSYRVLEISDFSQYFKEQMSLNWKGSCLLQDESTHLITQYCVVNPKKIYR